MKDEKISTNGSLDCCSKEEIKRNKEKHLTCDIDSKYQAFDRSKYNCSCIIVALLISLTINFLIWGWFL